MYRANQEPSLKMVRPFPSLPAESSWNFWFSTLILSLVFKAFQIFLFSLGKVFKISNILVLAVSMHKRNNPRSFQRAYPS